MNKVWYSARRDARGRRFVSRIERDHGEEFARPLPSDLGGRWSFDWGRSGLGSISLAIGILCDMLDENKGLSGTLWFEFEKEVIEHLPRAGWTISQEAIWDWILGGLTVESLDQAAVKVLKKGVC